MIWAGYPLPERPTRDEALARGYDPSAPTPRRCSHPTCRTSLDEYPVECPHGLPFCQHCTWEEACSECAA